MPLRIHRLALPALALLLCLAACDSQRTLPASTVREVVERMRAPRPCPTMVGNYRLELAPGETGRGGLVILHAGENALTLRGQYEKMRGRHHTVVLIPEQTVRAVTKDGVLMAPIDGVFDWGQGPSRTQAVFCWDGRELPELRAALRGDDRRQALRKVGPGESAISTAPVVTGFEPSAESKP